MSGYSQEHIPVNLPRQSWEIVVTMLARQPYDQVAPLIADISRQVQANEMRRRVTEPAPPRIAPGDYGPVSSPNGQAMEQSNG